MDPETTSLAEYKAQYAQLTAELADFQASSRELERELEKDIEAAEAREQRLAQKVETLGYQVDEWRTKYTQSKTEASAAQSSLEREVSSLRETNALLQAQLRDMELANDNYERQARNTSSSLEDLDSRYAVALERHVLAEQETRAGEVEREQLRADLQRHRDELADLRIEADIRQDKLLKAEQQLQNKNFSPATSTSSPPLPISSLSDSPAAKPVVPKVAARPSLPPMTQSSSLHHLQGLMSKMQLLEQRVHCVRSKLPAPTSTPPRASTRDSELDQIPSNVTVRSNKRRTMNASPSSPIRPSLGRPPDGPAREAKTPQRIVPRQSINSIRSRQPTLASELRRPRSSLGGLRQTSGSERPARFQLGLEIDGTPSRRSTLLRSPSRISQDFASPRPRQSLMMAAARRSASSSVHPA